MFENTFKNIDDILHKDAGCGSELDYVEQSSWVLFLKYLDDLEVERPLVLAPWRVAVIRVPACCSACRGAPC